MDIKLLRKLVEIPAPSGMEKKAAEFVERYFSDLGFSVKKDTLGNVVANPGAKVGFSAHVDEVSFLSMGGHIVPRGNIPIEYMRGGVELQTVDGKIVVVASDGEDWNSIRPAPELPDGTILTYKKGLTEIDDLLVGASLDNRVGVYTVLTLAKLLGDEFGYAITVQEEGGSHGARAASSWLQWEKTVVIDMFPTWWKEKNYYNIPKLRSGPHVLVLGAGGFPDPELVRAFQENGAKPTAILFSGGEFRRFFETRPRRAVEIGIAVANMHGPKEVVSKEDIEALINLITRTTNMIAR